MQNIELSVIMEFLKLITPFLVVLLAYWLGSRTYVRQKEYELVRARYLDNGIDKVAARVQEAINIDAHNASCGFRLIKLFRDVDARRAQTLCSSLKSLPADFLEDVAVIRLKELIQDETLLNVWALLYTTIQENHAYLRDDACGAIKALAGGGTMKVSRDQMVQGLENHLIDQHRNAARFCQLLTSLHSIALSFAEEKPTFRTVREFHKKGAVGKESESLKEEFAEELAQSDEALAELRKRGSRSNGEGWRANGT